MTADSRGESEGIETSRKRQDSFVSALLSASRALVAVSARSLAELDESVTLPQFRTLVILTAEGVTNLNRLAALLDVNASSAVRMVDRLLAAGLVVREENPDNRREVRLMVTPAGSEIVRRVVARRRREISRIVRRMADDVSEDLIIALTAFAEAAEQTERATTSDVNALGW